MKKLMYFFLICLWGLGIVGGLGSAIYCHAWPCAAGMIVVGLMSWDNVVGCGRKLMEV